MYNTVVNVVMLKYVLIKDDVLLTLKDYNFEALVFNSYAQACGVCPDGHHVREVVLHGSINV